MILLLATTLRRRIWIDSHRCFSVFAKFGSKRVRKTCVEKKYYATFFKEFMQLFLDAFGSAATDVSAFWLKKKMLFFHEILFFFARFFGFSRSLPTQMARQPPMFQRFGKAIFYNGILRRATVFTTGFEKNGRKIKKVRFFDKTVFPGNGPFSRATL